ISRSTRSPGRSPARRLDETDEAQLERLYKPVFVMKPSSCKCSEGQTARFDLKVVGRPMPDTYWFHNGKLNTAKSRRQLRMVNEFGYCSLDYEVAYARDSGVITCRATNKFGVDQTSATLIVKDEKGLGAGFGMEPSMHGEELWCFNIRGLYLFLWPSYYSCDVSDNWQCVAVYCQGLILAIELASQDLPY
uniref:Ig-like domain-containing protein n=1 Tax=Oryzias latipes TaxID=8090 RepID=A0A3P9IPS0_ORYLA